MNWTRLVRDLCDARWGLTPDQVCRWTLDQIWAMSASERSLARATGGLVSCGVSEVRGMGGSVAAGKSVAREAMERAASSPPRKGPGQAVLDFIGDKRQGK